MQILLGDPKFAISIALIFASIILFHRRENAALILLLLGTLIMRVWAAQLSPFLHMWDEQFHAVVAKNMTDNLLKPMLMPDVAPYSDKFTMWINGHIWLHKQPFFLWLMAISMNLFGTSEFTVRLPTVVLGTLSVFATFQIGKHLFSKHTGFIAAVLMSTSYIFISLTTGMETTDHNDAIFVSLITISFWFFSAYYKTRARYWVYLVGLAVGCAMLTKWVTGLLVFAPWFIMVIRDWRNKRALTDCLLALSVAAVIFLPWQLYALINYTDIYLQELAYNTLHFYEIIEDHSGGSFFHIEHLQNLYFDISYYYIIAIALMSFLAVWFSTRNINHLLITAFPILFVYLFFTLASTKMMLFPFMVSALMYVVFSQLLIFSGKIIFKWFSFPSVLWVVGVVLTGYLGYHNLRSNTIVEAHELNKTSDWSYHVMRTKERRDIEIMKKEIIEPGRKYIIFNTRPMSHPHFYFYTGIPSYDLIPNIENLQQNIEEGYTVIMLRTSKIPEDILEMPGIVYYDFPYWN